MSSGSTDSQIALSMNPHTSRITENVQECERDKSSKRSTNLRARRIHLIKRHGIRELSKFRVGFFLFFFSAFFLSVSPVPVCLREMKLHLDNTVGGVSEPLMVRDVAWSRGATLSRHRAPGRPRRAGRFSFPLRSLPFCSASRRVARER